MQQHYQHTHTHTYKGTAIVSVDISLYNIQTKYLILINSVVIYGDNVTIPLGY